MSNPELKWSELDFTERPQEQAVRALLEHLASAQALGELVFEIRASGGTIRYLLAADMDHHDAVLKLIASHVKGVQSSMLTKLRTTPSVSLAVRPSNGGLALRLNTSEAATRSILSALASAGEGEELVLQLVLGRRLPPIFDELPPRRYTSLPALLSGNPQPVDPGERNQHRTKRATHGFKAALRLGAHSPAEDRTRGLLRALLGALRTLEAQGLQLVAKQAPPSALGSVAPPEGLFARPMTMNSLEAAQLLAWPIGEGTLPGQPPRHPKRLVPPASMQNARRPFAVAKRAGRDLLVGLRRDDTLTHSTVIGRTGVGKSVLLSHLILDAVNDGRSVLAVDPKGDLISQGLLPRIPPSRRSDVVVIDPMSDLPVGINPFAERGSPELIADGLLAVFKTVYADSWGPRLEDILSSALLTLARTPGATLTMLPALLTDQNLRRRILKDIHDPVGLEPFWRSYEAMSPEQRAQVIAPVLNKLRPYLLRSGLRRTLGQAEPRFSMSELFTKRRIVFVNLNKGLLGAEGSRLLGALIVSQLWPLILSRAAVPPEKRHVVNVFIDEVQDYLALPTDLGSAYAQARGLGVSFSAGFQHRKQLPANLLAGLDTNARTTITFNLDYDDATALARRAPDLEPEDFMALGQYEIYANVMDHGTATGWFLARTLAPEPTTTDGSKVLRESLERYGRPAAEVDAEIEKAIGIGSDQAASDKPIGRRPKGEPS